MSVPEITCASLRFSGDDLDPSVVSKMLDQSPHRQERKGDVLFTNAKGVTRIAKTGLWKLSAPDRSDGDLEAQVLELLGSLTVDMDIWRALTEKFQACMFCGLFLKSANDELYLGAPTLQMLSERGLSIGFDMYEAPGD